MVVHEKVSTLARQELLKQIPVTQQPLLFCKAKRSFRKKARPIWTGYAWPANLICGHWAVGSSCRNQKELLATFLPHGRPDFWKS